MAEQLDYVAFEWVTSELDDTIKQARQALEAYSQDRTDFSKLRFTLTHSHQINGTLRMVQLVNLVALAEEMEAVAQALVNQSTTDEDSALETLMTALLQLPGLLERVKKFKDDISPAALQPIINELKTVRGAEPALAPKTIDFSAAFSSRVSREEFDDLMLKLRKMFRVAVLNIARNLDVEKNVRYLAQIGQRIHKISQNTAQETFWRAALGLFEAVEEGSLSISNEVADLLLEMDKLLINIASTGPEAMQDTAPDSVHRSVKALLVTVESECPLVNDLQKLWSEELKTPSELQAMGPDRDTLQSVVDALLEELASIKDYIDLFVRNQNHQEVDLEPALPVFQRVINTMMVLGLGDALRTVRRQAESVQQMVSGQLEPGPDALMEVAENIISVEAILKESVDQEDAAVASQTSERDRQLAAAFESVVSEARIGIEQAKEAVIEFIAHQWDHQRLTGVPQLLSEVRGGLMILPLQRAADILASCEWYVCEDLLLARRVPEWQMLDTLADALTSVDYYLERVAQDSPTESDMILDVAVESVAALGYPITDLQRWERRPELYDTSDIGEDDDLQITDFMVLDDDFDQFAAARLKDDIDAREQVVSTEPSASDAGTSINEPEATAEVDAVETLRSASAATDESGNQVNAEVDEEILEIFTEEVTEVLTEVDQHIGRMHDKDALVEIRRGFHTLKGSGRMVGANDAGELAWSIENMLNRVIDGSQSLTPAHSAIVRKARELMPELLGDFSRGTALSSRASEQLSELADAVSTGQSDICSAEQVDAVCASMAEATLETEPSDSIESLAQFDDELELDEDGQEFAINLLAEDSTSEETLQEPAAEELITPESSPGAELSAAENDAEDAEEALALQGIFTGEALEHLQTIDQYVADYRQGSANSVSENLHRALHTIKGSARIAGFEHIAAYVAPTEEFVLSLHQRRQPVDHAGLELLEAVSEQLRLDIKQLPEQPPESVAAAMKLQERAQDLLAVSEAEHETQASQNESSTEYGQLPALEYRTLLADRIGACDKLLAQAKAGRSACDALLRIADNLRVIAGHSVQQPQIEQLALANAELFEQAATLDWLPESFFALADQVQEGISTSVDCYAAGQEVQELDSWQQALQVAEEFDLSSFQKELHDVEEAVEEAEQLADEQIESSTTSSTDLLISRWMKDQLESPTPQEMAEQFFEAEPSGEQRAVLDSPDKTAPESRNNRSLFLAATGLLGRQQRADEPVLAVQPEPEPEQENIASLESNAAGTADAGQEAGSAEAFAENEASEADLASPEMPLADKHQGDAISESAIDDDRVEQKQEQEQAAAEQLNDEEPEVQPVPVTDESDEEADNEILELFTEEAVDLLEEIDEAIYAWRELPERGRHFEEVQRSMHTLKGGARLADVTLLGDLAHECESFIESADQSGGQFDSAFFQQLQSYVDRITTAVDQLRNTGEVLAETTHSDATEVHSSTSLPDEDEPTEYTAGETVTDSMAEEQPTHPAEALEGELLDPPADADLPNNVVQIAPSSDEDLSSQPAFAAVSGSSAAPATAESNKRATQEVVRVPSQLLENLVNLAGETSISRARAEEQVSDFGYSLDEMQGTVERLQDKLRRLEIETEAQILFRQEQVAQEGLDSFDPLEMDRYSQLQTLSRSLMESASDLLDLKSTMSEKARDMETLLLQQSRINTDLQEGLMQSRMVPFSRLVPRLRRIVRQVSTELGKQVEFELLNIEGEMDRSVLERMLPPLEHMLRNAVDHGIETADIRREYDKSPVGHISLGLMREGNEVVIILEDDGAGIDVARVRDKAIQAGLMSPDADLSEHEILQFIMETGVSTAREITQISGRGVGLDVVSSEIKQLGGAIEIDSRRGLGTKFVVRLPFTVSVNRALNVSVGNDMYAIPLNSIEGIVRVSPFELEAYYQPDAPRFEYAGQPYDLRYLGTMLGLEAGPNVRSYAAPLPVVLVRAGDHAVAIQVDGVHGSREVVVKSLGPQFGMVHGVSGATVLGDGRVVVILDLLAIIRQQASMSQPQRAHQLTSSEEPDVQDDTILVMVVDDSVTVRKVTSRFLERQGMRVLVARDGVDAMALLQDNTPDVMLLDIEMPRMDGFEVANQVRHDSRLKDTPIIMITSRTGDKHRERAFSIGVNKYLGKPYQEMELLDAIVDLIGAERLEQIG